MENKLQLQLEQINLGTVSLALYIPVPEKVLEWAGDTVPSLLYWSRLWPSSLALAQFIEEHPEYISGKTVLELGAGLGLPSLVAAATAASVVASDLIEDAIHAIKKSAGANNIQNLEAVVLDWHNLPENLSPDVLLLSDVNYDHKEFDHLVEMVSRFLEKGTTVLLSTPPRLWAKPFLQQLLLWQIRQELITVNLHSQYFETSVFVLKKDGSF